eukprot:6525_1
MSDEKENKYIDDNDEEIDDSDEEIDDGYKIVQKTDNLLASGMKKRDKQNDSNKENAKNEIEKNLISIKRNEESDDIQKCIGQVVISYDGSDDDYYYGTGTMYKQLGGKKYYLIITCAHNLVKLDDKKNELKSAAKLFYLPNGVKQQGIRLQCLHWIAHESYDARIDHCENDIGIILCYDGKKYYKKQNINVNEIIRIDTYNRNELKSCRIFGYPVLCEGLLMGKYGTAIKESEYNEWKYTNINTYPGQSGSAVYK